jgi:hypothetical protein
MPPANRGRSAIALAARRSVNPGLRLDGWDALRGNCSGRSAGPSASQRVLSRRYWLTFRWERGHVHQPCVEDYHTRREPGSAPRFILGGLPVGISHRCEPVPLGYQSPAPPRSDLRR